jgi:hypothetical protein
MFRPTYNSSQSIINVKTIRPVAHATMEAFSFQYYKGYGRLRPTVSVYEIA